MLKGAFSEIPFLLDPGKRFLEDTTNVQLISVFTVVLDLFLVFVNHQENHFVQMLRVALEKDNKGERIKE
jgi:hypothetical protein